MTNAPEFILASASPRRRELLRRAGYRFRVVPPTVDEPPSAAEHATPAQLAEALAYFKARSVAERYPGEVVLGADTVAALDGEVFGKADDADEARRMLRRFSDTTQEVITGLAVLAPPHGPNGLAGRMICSEVTCVTMRPLSEAEIDAYVASGEWIDKAGAYAIQETGDAFVERVEGSLTNVIGLPMELLERLLARLAGSEAACGE
jgi:septum formation protein